jgi:hypothetical protein
VVGTVELPSRAAYRAAFSPALFSPAGRIFLKVCSAGEFQTLLPPRRPPPPGYIGYTGAGNHRLWNSFQVCVRLPANPPPKKYFSIPLDIPPRNPVLLLVLAN